MTGDYLWDFSGPRDQEIVRLEGLLSALAQTRPPAPLRLPAARPRRQSRAAIVVVALATAAVVTLALVVRFTPIEQTKGWEVTRVTGAPVVASKPMEARAALREGKFVETRADGRVSIAIADIGQVQLEPDTRLGLLRAQPGHYRLRLDRGTMHALIWSPPGQFFVETASATAVDLGCAYTMTVEDGVGLIRVTSGWVGFSWRGQEAFIPEGAVCVTRPTLGPGTPHYDDVTETFRSALERLDTRAGTPVDRSEALARVLAEARPRDALTLWHLLSRAEQNERDQIFDRLAAFVPPPAGVTREGIRAGQRQMQDRWWDALGLGSTNWWRVWQQQWRQNGPPN